MTHPQPEKMRTTEQIAKALCHRPKGLQISGEPECHWDNRCHKDIKLALDAKDLASKLHNERLVEGLKRYGQHDDDCKLEFDTHKIASKQDMKDWSDELIEIHPCTCGYDNILASSPSESLGVVRQMMEALDMVLKYISSNTHPNWNAHPLWTEDSIQYKTYQAMSNSLDKARLHFPGREV